MSEVEATFESKKQAALAEIQATIDEIEANPSEVADQSLVVFKQLHSNIGDWSNSLNPEGLTIQWAMLRDNTLSELGLNQPKSDMELMSQRVMGILINKYVAMYATDMYGERFMGKFRNHVEATMSDANPEALIGLYI